MFVHAKNSTNMLNEKELTCSKADDNDVADPPRHSVGLHGGRRLARVCTGFRSLPRVD